MEKDLAIKLCNSARLSPALQRELWTTGDQQVRERLVRRGDLEHSIEEKVYRDEALIPHWVRAVREPYKIEIACSYASNEETLLSIVTSRDLTPRAVEIILSKASSNVAWEILKIADISRESRIKALQIFNQNASLTSSNFGEALLDTFGYDISNWVEALKVSGWANSGIILQCARYYKESRDVETILLIKFKELDDFLRENKIDLSENTPLNRDIFKTWEVLLNNYNLSNSELSLFNQCNFVKENSEYARTLKNRLSFDFKKATESLTCEIKSYNSNFKDRFEHAKNLEALLTLTEISNLNGPQIAMEALIHSDIVEPPLVKKALSNLSRADLTKLYYLITKTLDFKSKNSHILENLIKDRGIISLKVNELKLSKRKINALLDYLAGIGHRDINENNLSKRQRKRLYKKLAPARLNLEQPEFATLLLSTLESLKKDEREFAFSLLNHWDGDLDSLIEASKKINKNN